MPTYRQVLRQARQKAEAAGIGSESVQILMLEKTQMDNTNLYLHYDEAMPEAAIAAYARDVDRLLSKEPLAYVLGYQWFYGYKLAVSRDVLIPRYETEELVANVLADIDQLFPDRRRLTAADVATGSGNIAIALAKEEPKLRLYATDISAKALKLAAANAASLGCHITLLHGSMLAPLIAKGVRLDVLVCNPPYIPVHQDIDPSVKDHEPHLALFGGQDGLRFYRMVFRDAPQVIKRRCLLAFEIGYDEKDALLQAAHEHFPADRIEVLKDINGKDRMLFIYHGFGSAAG